MKYYERFSALIILSTQADISSKLNYESIIRKFSNAKKQKISVSVFFSFNGIFIDETVTVASAFCLKMSLKGLPKYALPIPLIPWCPNVHISVTRFLSRSYVWDYLRSQDSMNS